MLIYGGAQSGGTTGMRNSSYKLNN